MKCDLRVMPGLVLATMLAIAAQAAAPAAQPTANSGSPFHNLVFARESRDGWSLQAINVFEERGGVPIINRMLCRAEREGVQMETWRQGGVSIMFGGPIRRDNRERILRGSRLRALVVDGIAYEVEPRADGSRTDRYTDVAYPDSQIVYPPDEMFFNLAVKRQDSALWLDISSLTDELIGAERVRVGFQVEDGAPLFWLDVPMTGLNGALVWCQAAMASPAALRFHQP
jgi:hypothetical protein